MVASISRLLAGSGRRPPRTVQGTATIRLREIPQAVRVDARSALRDLRSLNSNISKAVLSLAALRAGVDSLNAAQSLLGTGFGLASAAGNARFASNVQARTSGATNALTDRILGFLGPDVARALAEASDRGILATLLPQAGVRHPSQDLSEAELRRRYNNLEYITPREALSIGVQYRTPAELAALRELRDAARAEREEARKDSIASPGVFDLFQEDEEPDDGPRPPEDRLDPNIESRMEPPSSISGGGPLDLDDNQRDDSPSGGGPLDLIEPLPSVSGGGPLDMVQAVDPDPRGHPRFYPAGIPLVGSPFDIIPTNTPMTPRNARDLTRINHYFGFHDTLPEDYF